MKKTILTLTLILALTTATFADGDTPSGNRCSPNPCLVQTNTEPEQKEVKENYFVELFKYFKDLFDFNKI